jgi:hypothetical protein
MCKPVKNSSNNFARRQKKRFFEKSCSRKIVFFSLVSRPTLGVIGINGSELPGASFFDRFTNEFAFLKKWEMNYKRQKIDFVF